MLHWVHVAIRGSSTTVDGPAGSQQEAEQQLAKIRDTLGSDRAPDLPWLEVTGKDILSAEVISHDGPSIG